MDEKLGFITIAEAATTLGVKPFEVVRLIEAGQVRTVTLVEAASLPKETA